MSIGTLVCFLFAKNVVKHIKTDSKTGEWDIELKASLDDTMRDITVSALKVILSVGLATAFTRFQASKANRPALPAPAEPVGDGKIHRCDDFINRFIEWVTNKLTDAGHAFTDSAVQLGEEIGAMPNAFIDFVGGGFKESFSSTAKTLLANQGFIETATQCFNNYSQLIQLTLDAAGQKSVDMANESYGSQIFDDSIEVDVRTDGGEATTEISVLTAMYVIVSHTFDVTGISQLDCFAEDYSTYVPKELAHMPREELIEKLREMGAMSEVEFLTKGSTSEETCTSTDTSTGVDVDFETVMRIDGMPSGGTNTARDTGVDTGIDTGVDTGTGI